MSQLNFGAVSDVKNARGYWSKGNILNRCQSYELRNYGQKECDKVRVVQHSGQVVGASTSMVAD